MRVRLKERRRRRRRGDDVGKTRRKVRVILFVDVPFGSVWCGCRAINDITAGAAAAASKH